MCFLYLYLLIKPFKNCCRSTPVFMLWPASDCVVVSRKLLHTQKYCRLFKIEWYHLIVKAVVKCVFLGVTNQ